MDLYSAIKPAFIILLIIAAVGRTGFLFFKKETRTMWMTIGIAAVVIYFINGPEETLNSLHGLIHLVLNWLSSIGG